MSNHSFLECISCQQLNYDVIILDCCFSTLCLKCYEQIFIQYKDLENNLITCLKCLKKIDISSKTPNLFLRSFFNCFNLTKKLNTSKNLCCDRCEKDNEEISLCLDCNKSFCNSCYTNIHNIGRFKFHKKMNAPNKNKFVNSKAEEKEPKEFELYCKEHSTEKTTAICLKDNKLVCCVCQINHMQSCKNPTFINLKYYILFRFKFD